MNNWERGFTGARKVSVAFLPICDQFRIGKWNVLIWISKNVISQVMMKSSKLISFKFSFFNLFQSTWKRSIITLQSVWAANDAKVGLERKTPPTLPVTNVTFYKTCYWGRIMLAKIDILTSQHMACLHQLVFFSPVIICHVLGLHYHCYVSCVIISWQIFTNWTG